MFISPEICISLCSCFTSPSYCIWFLNITWRATTCQRWREDSNAVMQWVLLNDILKQIKQPQGGKRNIKRDTRKPDDGLTQDRRHWEKQTRRETTGESSEAIIRKQEQYTDEHMTQTKHTSHVLKLSAQECPLVTNYSTTADDCDANQLDQSSLFICSDTWAQRAFTQNLANITILYTPCFLGEQTKHRDCLLELGVSFQSFQCGFFCFMISSLFSGSFTF